MIAASTVPVGVARDAHSYFTAGGVANTAQELRFLVDTVLLEGFGFAPRSTCSLPTFASS